MTGWMSSCWNVKSLEILGEVRLGESLDAIVGGLDAAHHALPPPIVDDALRDLCARPVEAIERPGGDILEILRPVGK